MSKKRRKVLLVDDEPHVTSALRRVLRKEPYDVLVAADAEQALGMLEENEVDVIVTDEGLPRISGTDLLAIVRHRWPDVARIMLTGKMDLGIAKAAINEGQIYRFFTKPCNEFDLLFGIRSALEVTSLKRESTRLLAHFRHQRRYLEELERENPDLCRVQRDASGAVLVELDDLPGDVDAFLEEISAEIEHADLAFGGGEEKETGSGDE